MAVIEEGQPVELTWQTTSPPNLMGTLEDRAKEVAARTGGRLAIKPYPTGGLVNEFDLFPGVQKGIVDIGFTTSGYGASADMLPRSAVGELPNWPSGQAGSEFTKVVRDRFVKPDMEALGVVPLFYEINMADDFDYAVAPYITDIYANKVYRSLEELRGKRVLAQHETAADALRVVGIEPVRMPYIEAIDGMRSGRIDGVLSTSVLLLFYEGITDIVKCCVRLGFQQSEDAFMIMKKETYDALPADLQKVVAEEMQGYWKSVDRTAMNRHSVALLDRLIASGDITEVVLSQAEQRRRDEAWGRDLLNLWIARQERRGVADPRGLVAELQRVADRILAAGTPQYDGPSSR
jgi:TRAP-type C4-dicarboxylate transport system substrate-binding protein